MEKTAFVESGSVSGEVFNQFALLVSGKEVDLLHVVAVVGMEADEIGCAVEQSVAIDDRGYGFGAFKTPFAEQHGADIGQFGLVGLIDELLHPTAKGGTGITLYTQLEVIDLEGADDVASGVYLVALIVEVLFQVAEVAAKTFVFGVQDDFHDNRVGECCRAVCLGGHSD